MHPYHRVALVTLLALAGAILLGPAATLAQAPTPTPFVLGPSPTPTTGAAANAYTSPTYGFSLTWDAAWRVVDQSSANGEDRLRLSNGPSEVAFRAHPGFGGDPAACLAAMIQALASEPGARDVGPAYDTAGNPLQGSGPDQVWAVVVFNAGAAGTATPSVAYLVCRTLIVGTAVLEISHRTTLAAFNTQAPLVQALLARLVPPTTTAAGPAPAGTAVATASGGVDCTGVAAWLAATRPRIDRVAAIGKAAEMMTGVDPRDVLATWTQWAEELKLLADEQASTATPPAAAQLNADLVATLRGAGDLFDHLVAAAVAGDYDAIVQIQHEFEQGAVAFDRLRADIDHLAQQCGVTA